MCVWKMCIRDSYTGSKEELLPGFEKDFPYIVSRAELDKYIGCYVPWHWPVSYTHLDVYKRQLPVCFCALRFSVTRMPQQVFSTSE